MKLNNETIKSAVWDWFNNKNYAESEYGHISNWDTSEVTNMSLLFGYRYDFNDDIGRWDTSNVTNMYGMFLVQNHLIRTLGVGTLVKLKIC